MEMEAAPVSAVTGALKPVIGKLATLMGDEYERLGMACGEEIKSLADELSAINAALLDMSGEEDPDAQDRAWTNEVRELSYDMEDSIDDFMQTIHDEGVEPDHGFFMEKMKDSLEKMKARRRTGDDLKEQINRVGKGNGRYETHGTFSNTVHATVDPAAIAMFELLTKQDGPKAELIKLLTEDEAGCEPLLAQVDGGHESLLAEDDGCELPLAEEEGGSELPLVEEEDRCKSPLAEEEEGGEPLQVEDDECHLALTEEQEKETAEEECESPKVESVCEPAPAEEEECESPKVEEDDVCEPTPAEEEECESPKVEDDDVCEPALGEEDECESPKVEDEAPCELRTRKQPKLVAIVGAGGTVLANKVYEELRVKDFDNWPFISMSANPDMTSTLIGLLLELTGEFKKEASVEQLVIDINESLLDKRYLIVIDGICEKETWDVIKHAFPMTSCGIIITTTPREDIAELCRSSFNGHIYHVRPLGMVHSRPLFHQRLFNSDDDCHPHLEQVSDQILEKCDDLPLAILVTSGLLANTERTEHLWNHMADSIGCALETSDIAERMMKILSLCYSDLHPRLKTCLLYLSMFRKGSTIKMKDLIWRWTAEGFFHGEQRNAAYELGERCFNELLNRSLIQPVKDQSGKVKSCQVHDTVMDFIISKYVEDNFVTVVGVPCPTIDQTQMKVRRFSLQATEEGYSFPGTDLVLSHARSLKVFGSLWEIPSLDKFKHLRVVDFGGFSTLGDDDLAYIGRLFQLRYLNLSWTRVLELPEEIGNLCCLEMLDLTAAPVSKLPSSIVNLEKLVHLLISEFVEFPEGGIGKMQALETLKQVNAFKQPIQFLQDFGKLQNLWKLNINLTNYQGETEETKECMKAIASSLYELGTRNLRSLTIWNCGYSLLMEEWCPAPVGLQKLVTWRSTFPRVPDWMSSLVNLQRLQFDLERVRYEDLCILGGLPALLTLQIAEKEMSEGNVPVSGDMGFPMLRDFTYTGLGIEIVFESGSMPKLEKLIIDFCPATNVCLFSEGGLTGSGPFDFGIENLPSSLTTVVCHCHSFDGDNTLEATRAALERAVSTHPSCPALDFDIY